MFRNHLIPLLCSLQLSPSSLPPPSCSSLLFPTPRPFLPGHGQLNPLLTAEAEEKNRVCLSWVNFVCRITSSSCTWSASCPPGRCRRTSRRTWGLYLALCLALCLAQFLYLVTSVQFWHPAWSISSQYLPLVTCPPLFLGTWG